MNAKVLRAALDKRSSPDKARKCAKYFKTGKGEYGEGDIFIGVTVPDVRKIAKEFSDLEITEIKKALQSPIHEMRLAALLILNIKAAKKDIELKRLANFYLQNKKHINNWDLVDTSAMNILGPYYFDKDKKDLLSLAKSKNLWDRRIAVLTSYHYIRKNNFEFTLKLCDLLLKDKHDLIHKATGWMLREIGKRDLSTLRTYLSKNAAVMPRTMLRYSIEKLPQDERQKWLRKGPPT